MQIRRHRCSHLLAIDACLFTKIVFLLSRIATKIDFCGATGHDHGGWLVAAGGGQWSAVCPRLGGLQVMDVDVGCRGCDGRDV